MNTDGASGGLITQALIQDRSLRVRTLGSRKNLETTGNG
jgi:hypothetical protein